MGLLRSANLESTKSRSRFTAPGAELSDSGWRGLYRVGGAAALMAGVLFRRNIGPEISLISAQGPPGSVVDWFTLLHNNRLLGLAYLDFFDIIDYILVGLMFLALYAALRRTNPGAAAIATSLGWVGIAVCCAANTAFSMLSLSDQFSSASTEAQRALFLAAGQAVLAIQNPGAIFPGTGIYLSFLLLAVAGLIFSVAMLRSNLFSRASAYIGILASVLDLVYCITFAFLPALTVYLLSTAGLLLMVWHILVGLRLLGFSAIRQSRY